MFLCWWRLELCGFLRTCLCDVSHCQTLLLFSCYLFRVTCLTGCFCPCKPSHSSIAPLYQLSLPHTLTWLKPSTHFLSLNMRVSWQQYKQRCPGFSLFSCVLQLFWGGIEVFPSLLADITSEVCLRSPPARTCPRITQKQPGHWVISVLRSSSSLLSSS